MINTEILAKGKENDICRIILDFGIYITKEVYIDLLVEDAKFESEARPEAGAGASVEAMTALMVVTAQEVFFMSMVMKRIGKEAKKVILRMQLLFLYL
ncbi:hypothetical protein REPUB_Repub09cG0179500 [Reevesia pubescens]